MAVRQWRLKGGKGGERRQSLTHQLMGTHPWKPVREKKQEWRPNWVAKKMELAKTKVLKKTRYLITGSSSPGLHRTPVFRGVHRLFAHGMRWCFMLHA